MASNHSLPLLPEEQWIYMTSDRAAAQGLWVYISKKTISNIQDRATSPIKELVPENPIGTLGQPGFEETLPQESYMHSPSMSSLSIGSQEGTSPRVVEIDETETFTTGNTTEASVIPIPQVPEDPKTMQSICKETGTLMNEMLSCNEIDEDLRGTISPNPISPITSPTTAKLNQITARAPTPQLGINIPQQHEPSTLTDPPEQDPEVRAKKRQKPNNEIEEYDPTNPTINKQNNRIPCPMCNRSFKTKGSYNRHYRSRHTEDIYECDMCGKELYRKDSIRKHYMNQHPNDELPAFITEKTNKSRKAIKVNIKSKTSPTTSPQTQFNQTTTTSPTDPNDLLKKLIDSITALHKPN
jgi:hypothetical protein